MATGTIPKMHDGSSRTLWSDANGVNVGGNNSTRIQLGAYASYNKGLLLFTAYSATPIGYTSRLKFLIAPQGFLSVAAWPICTLGGQASYISIQLDTNDGSKIICNSGLTTLIITEITLIT